MKFQTICLLSALSAAQTEASSALRVVAIGDSVTAGSNVDESKSYTNQLITLLDNPYWDIQNFGVADATLQRGGDKPYWDEENFRLAMEYEPDIVFMMFGTDDSKNFNETDFKKSYIEMTETLDALPS